MGAPQQVSLEQRWVSGRGLQDATPDLSRASVRSGAHRHTEPSKGNSPGPGPPRPPPRILEGPQLAASPRDCAVGIKGRASAPPPRPTPASSLQLQTLAAFKHFISFEAKQH